MSAHNDASAGGSLGRAVPGPERPGRGTRALLGLLLAALALNVLLIVRLPAPFVDDAWYANRGWALIRTGLPFGTLDAGVFDRFDGYWTYIPALWAWLQSIPIRVLGLSLFSVRLPSLAFGLMLLAAVYVETSRLASRRAALVAALLTALSGPFIESSHLGRPDMAVAALGFTALALYVADGSAGLSVKSIASGLVVALAFEMHPNGAIYAPAIAALYLLDHGVRLLRVRRFWGFAAGLGIGLSLYAAVHILPYPQTYATLTRVIYGAWRTPPILALDPGLWLRSLAEAFALAIAATPLRAPLVAAALILPLRKKALGNGRVLCFSGVLLLACAALVRHKLLYFAIEVTPAADILLGAFLVRIWEERGRILRRAWAVCAVMATVAMLVLGATAMSLAPALFDPMPEYESVVAGIKREVPGNTSIMGSQTYWLGMPDQAYYSWENLVYYQLCVPGSTLEDALQALRPGYLVVDAHLAQFITDDPSSLSEYNRFLSLPKARLERFLAEHGRLVASVETQAFGQVRLYRIDWDDGTGS